MKFSFGISLLFSLILLAGCSQRLGNFTVLSTKNTELGKKYVRAAVDQRVSGVDTKQIIVIIPMGIPNLQEATDRALEKYGAQILTNVVVYYDYFYIPWVYGETKYRVEGDAWKKVDDLNAQVEKDVNNAQQVFTLKEVNGKQEFVSISKNDPIIDTIH